MNKNQTAGEFIRCKRKRLKLTLTDLSEKAGVSIATISRIEHDSDALFSHVAAIAIVLDISLDHISDLAMEE
jgi:transcriptional regulator with XRE-family HTH domain